MQEAGKSREAQERLEEEAVAWIVRLTSGEATEADRHDANAWRRRSPAHDLAFRKAHRLWAGMDGLRHELAGRNGSLDADPPGPPPSRRVAGGSLRAGRPRVWAKWGAFAATMAALVITFALQSGLMVRLASDYSTGTGERFTAALTDGSLLHLNTQAAVAVRYTDTTRLVELLQGEAAFRVEKDAGRPFVVQVQGGQVRAVGTEFLVRKTSNFTQVTVVEGVVEVRAAPDRTAGGSPVLVRAGEGVRYDRDGLGAIVPVNLHIATAWQRGKLIFESAPLAVVIDEINRYRPGRVVLINDALARHPVSGVFDIERLDSAVTTIAQTLPVTTISLASRFVLFR